DARVVLRALPELDEVREDEVEDAEQQQGPHELPQVAQRRAVELQPEVGNRQRARQRDEAAPVLAERGRAAHNPHVGADRGHARTPSRSIAISNGMSTTASVSRVPVTTTDAKRSRRSTHWMPPP